MIDSKFRNLYEKHVISLLLKVSFIKRLSPHSLTILALFVGISTAPLLAFHLNKTAIAALIFSGLLDTLDGSIARFQHISSPKGAVLDITSDRAVEFSFILGLYLLDPSRGLFCLFMLGSVLLCITSFLVVGIFSKNDSQKSFYYSPGMIERTEAFAFFIACIAFPNYFVFLSISFSILVLVTAMKRIIDFQKSVSPTSVKNIDIKETEDKF